MLCSPELEARGEHKANHVLFHGAIVSPLPSLLLIKPQQSLPVLHPIAKLAFFCRCQECREIMAAFEHGDHAAQSQLSAQFLAVLVLDDYMLDFGVSCIASPPHPVCAATLALPTAPSRRHSRRRGSGGAMGGLHGFRVEGSGGAMGGLHGFRVQGSGGAIGVYTG